MENLGRLLEIDEKLSSRLGKSAGRIWKVEQKVRHYPKRALEFSTEYWPTHRRGQKTRQEILKLLAHKDSLSLQDLSRSLGICDRQVRKHLKILIQEGKVGKASEDRFFHQPRI